MRLSALVEAGDPEAIDVFLCEGLRKRADEKQRKLRPNSKARSVNERHVITPHGDPGGGPSARARHSTAPAQALQAFFGTDRSRSHSTAVSVS